MGLLYIVALPAILACHIGILATSFARRRYGAAGVEPGPSRFAYSRCIAASTAARLRHYGDLPHELRGRCRRYIEALGVVLEHAPRHGWMAATRLAHTMAATVLAVFFVASIVLNDETALASFGGVRLYVWISAAALILNMPLGDPPPRSMEARSTTAEVLDCFHQASETEDKKKEQSLHAVRTKALGGLVWPPQPALGRFCEDVLASVLVVPYYLLVHLPRHHGALYAAVRDATVDVEPCGNVCFAAWEAVIGAGDEEGMANDDVMASSDSLYL